MDLSASFKIANNAKFKNL